MRLRLLFTLAAAFLPSASGSDLLQTPELDGGWTVLEADGSVRLVDPRGALRTVRLPAGGRVSDVGRLQRGWALAGTRPTGETNGLFLLTDDGGVVHQVATPTVAPGSLVGRPSLLVDAGGVAGLAWLEGDGPRSLAVRVAVRRGDAWGTTRTIAPPAPGSQLALRSAVLDDGRWLLAWSAYDGSDDEILWTVGRPDGVWSPPARVAGDNTVPDITPAVLATPDGAALAWSRFAADGEYHVVLSRFDGAAWSAPVEVSGAGGVRPTLHRGAATLVLYRQVEPDSWVVREIDGQGRPGRIATVVSERGDRPRLAGADGDGVELSWPRGVAFESRSAAFGPATW